MIRRDQAESRSLVFAALSDPNRRAIVEMLVEHGEGTATQLAAPLAMSRQAAAKHLGLLGAAGLTRSERVGRETRYMLDPAPLTEVVSWIAIVERDWNNRLDLLRAALEGEDEAD